VLKSEFPKLLIFVGVIFDMFSGVFIASAVAEPNVKATIG
jgi:hypothetical protein